MSEQIQQFGTETPINHVKKGFAPLSEQINNYEQELKNRPQTICTGFGGIDKDFKINGFTMLGGASGSGKTSLCLNIALKRAEKKLTTIFYSLEMPVYTLVNRLVCISRNVDYLHAPDFWRDFQQNNATALQYIYFVGGKDLLTDSSTTPNFDTGENSELITTIKQLQQTQKDILLIVDSLHLLPANTADLRAATNENVIKIRQLTDNYNISCLVIGQSKRGEKSFEYVSDIYDKQTGQFDTAQLRAQFRESALIEYAADALFYLLNDKQPPDALNTAKKWLCMVKNRIADAGLYSTNKIIGFTLNDKYLFVEKYNYQNAVQDNTETPPTAETAQKTAKTAQKQQFRTK